MLNFASLSKASPEMIPASSANSFGVSSSVPGASSDFSSALQGAWAGHSNAPSANPGSVGTILRRVQPSPLPSEKSSSSPASNASAPWLSNPSAGAAGISQPSAPQPFDSTAENSSTPSPLRAVAGEVASAALTLLGVPSFLAGGVANSLLGLIQGAASKGSPGGDSSSNSSAKDLTASAAADPSSAKSSAECSKGSGANGSASPSGSTSAKSDQNSAASTAIEAAVAVESQALSQLPLDSLAKPSTAAPQPPTRADASPQLPALAAPVNGAAAQGQPSFLSAAQSSNFSQAAGQIAGSAESGLKPLDSQIASAFGSQKVTQEASTRIQSALDAPSVKNSPATSGGSAGAAIAAPSSANRSANHSSSDQDASKQSSNSGPGSSSDSGSSSADANRFDTALANSNGKSAPVATLAVAAATAASGTVSAAAAAAQASAAGGQELASQSAAGAPRSAAQPSQAGPSSQPFPLPQTLPGSLNDVVKASELYQRVGGAEMHITMQTDLMGAIDLRASLHQSELTATIGVQRGDVQTLLSNELPSLQHSLSDKSFRVDQISVLHNSVGGRLDLGGQRQSQSQPQSQPHAPALPFSNSSRALEIIPLSIPDAALETPAIGRLNIHV